MAHLPELEPFVAALPFTLSTYQQEALAHLAVAGRSLIVVAPTGSGKSVVADAALWQALQVEGGSAIYATPLRALANQRFAQLSAQWGNRAGLVTGDTTLRPNAPLKVMTAEVYRTLALLPDAEVSEDGGLAPGSGRGRKSHIWEPPACVVFDEAHYLADPQRGSAWEEAILATPPETRIVCLSATIGAPERLVEWLRWLGRDVALVHATERPVPLRHALFNKGALHVVLDERGRPGASFPFAGGWALAQRRPARHFGGRPGKRRPPPLPFGPTIPPAEWTRQEALSALAELRAQSLTPTIAFVSSRRETEQLAEAARRAFPEDADGVAFHHAGLPPAARREIEERLRKGSLWLVCGTTTLAAGIDVPARSVLVTSFGRFDGRAFSLFSAVEYAQLAGRAGRLGKDEQGVAVLLTSPWHAFDEAFRHLTAPLPALESAFRVGYPTALAWWGSGGETALARALSTTFSAYLRRVSAAKGAAKGAPPVIKGPDGSSVLQARAIGRLLVADGLVDADGALTRRGWFVLRAGGGAEGRLFLRLLEEGAFDALAEDGRLVLLESLAEGPPAVSATVSAGTATAVATSGDPVARVVGAYHQARRAQVAREREHGALLTPEVMPVRAPTGAVGGASSGGWRRRQAAADLLERALRGARAASLNVGGLLDWGPPLLEHLERVAQTD
jgi:superfamily II DNA or RNA helicase